ncbi:MAG: substrate-binding domain-containing protein, partial [Candidatus Omnitrophota bacterium]
RVPKVTADLVSTDNIEGGRLATEILIQKKGKKIGFLCGAPHPSSSQERLLGYRRALQDNSIRYNTHLIRYNTYLGKKGVPLDFDFGSQSASTLIHLGIDSIFVANEPITVEVMKAVKESKKEIKVVSFDEPKIPPHLPHPIAFVTQPRQVIGRVAGQILLERIKRGNSNEPAKRISLAPQLIKFF